MGYVLKNTKNTLLSPPSKVTSYFVPKDAQCSELYAKTILRFFLFNKFLSF